MLRTVFVIGNSVVIQHTGKRTRRARTVSEARRERIINILLNMQAAGQMRIIGCTAACVVAEDVV